MSDWGNVQQGLVSGYQVGRNAGGKLSGLGIVLNKIASRLKTERETSEELQQKKNLLGYEGEIKMKLAQQEADLKPKTEAIVSDTGEIIGNRPVGSVFQPRPDPTEAIIAALGGGGKTIPQKVPPTEEKVLVINPEGKKGYIPKSQLQDALNSGYKRTIR